MRHNIKERKERERRGGKEVTHNIKERKERERRGRGGGAT